MIDICMLIHNRPRITTASLAEIHNRTTTPHRLIVYDNGSDEGTRVILQEFQMAGIIDLVVFSQENNGVHWGHNKLLERVETPLFVSTDNDIIPESPVDGVDWLAKLIYLMEENEDYAAIACRPHAMIGDNVNRMFPPAAPPLGERGPGGAVLGLMRTPAVIEVGGWDQVKRPSRNHEERWICKRLREAGYKVGYSAQTYALHLWGNPNNGED